jgi:methyl-accepting chemotaxis protein
MLKWKRGAAPAADESSPPARSDAALSALRNLSRSISYVGRDAAAVRGALDDTQRVMVAQGQAMQALGAQLQDIAKSQQNITLATEQSAAAVTRARSALSSVGGEVQGIAQTLAKVSEAAADITKISLQTRLVAFNASVEAKHAGDAGRGFGVVADAIKALAAQVEGSSKAIVSAIAALQQRIDDFGAQLTENDSKAGRKSEIHAAFQAVQDDVKRIAESAQSGAAQMGALNGRAQELEREVGEASHGLKVALDGSDRFLKLSEELIEQIAGSGVEVEDGEFIRLAQGAGPRSVACSRPRCAGATSPRPSCSTRTTARCPAPTRPSTWRRSAR